VKTPTKAQYDWIADKVREELNRYLKSIKTKLN